MKSNFFTGWYPATDRSCKPIEIENEAGCVTDDECSIDAACVNRICMDPCDCGTGAECFITEHRPICRCPEGLIGNPQIACVDPGKNRYFIKITQKLEICAEFFYR